MRTDLIGMKFGRLTIREMLPECRCSCDCDCGAVGVRIYYFDVTKGESSSCGCLRRELITIHGNASRGEQVPEYRAWAAMKQRCLNPKLKGYKNYGGRGISICSEWSHDFQAFLSHVGRRTSPVHTLGRINNEIGYHPGNVRWETRSEQAQNTRTNVKLTHRGITQSIAAWARDLGLNKSTVCGRLKAGWPQELALSSQNYKGQKGAWRADITALLAEIDQLRAEATVR